VLAYFPENAAAPFLRFGKTDMCHMCCFLEYASLNYLKQDCDTSNVSEVRRRQDAEMCTEDFGCHTEHSALNSCGLMDAKIRNLLGLVHRASCTSQNSRLLEEIHTACDDEHMSFFTFSQCC